MGQQCSIVFLLPACFKQIFHIQLLYCIGLLYKDLSELGYIYIQMTSHDSFFERFFDSAK